MYFPKNARVVFIGDSITAEAVWASCVADYFYRNCKEQGVQFFPCAISGSDITATLHYLRDNVLQFAPTHAVIMLGTNDLASHLYSSGPISEEQKKNQAEALVKYRHRLIALADTLRKIGLIPNLTFMSPIPFDYSAPMPEGTREGIAAIDDATRYCNTIVAEVAAETDARMIDMYTPLRPVMDDLAAQGLALTRDRVHPTIAGYHALARVVLRGMGFDVEAPTAASIADGSVMMPLSEKGQAFFEIAERRQMLFTAIFLIGRYAPDQRVETQLAFADPYPSAALPEWYGDAEGFKNFAKRLIADLAKKEELDEALRVAAEAMTK